MTRSKPGRTNLHGSRTGAQLPHIGRRMLRSPKSAADTSGRVRTGSGHLAGNAPRAFPEAPARARSAVRRPPLAGTTRHGTAPNGTAEKAREHCPRPRRGIPVNTHPQYPHEVPIFSTRPAMHLRARPAGRRRGTPGPPRCGGGDHGSRKPASARMSRASSAPSQSTKSWAAPGCSLLSSVAAG